MESPQNNIWGPNLWMILHSSAQRFGSKTLKRLPSEEIRIWNGLLSSLRWSLPCPQCKKHYSEYFLKNPIKDICIWLYNLHNRINVNNNKTEMPNEILDDYSKIFNFTHHYSIVLEHMNNAIRKGWSTRNDVQRTLRFLNELKCFYDFF